MDMYDILLARNLGGSGGTVDAYTKAQTDALLNGKANLVDGKIPAAELPSYVDDVLEYAGTSAFPVTGESGKIYIATDTNKTYRWGGSAYVEISESLALGETASTAYPGNKGKANADAIAAIKDGTNVDSFADVEIALSAKLNTADVDTALSSTSTNPVQNKAVQAPLARLVDAGAKNLLSISSSSPITRDFVFEAIAINLPAGSYIFVADIADYNSRSQLIVENANRERITDITFNNTDSVTISFNVTETGTTASLYTLGGTFSNMMICTAEDYAISSEFVPYAMSNAGLTDTKQDKNAINIGTTNFDDIKQGGTYFSGNVGTSQNAPTSGYFLLNVMRGASDSFVQEAYRLNFPDKVYRRHFVINAWSAWYVFTGTVVSQ